MAAGGTGAARHGTIAFVSYKAQPLVAGGPNIVEGVYSRAGETVRFGDQPVPMTFAANTVVIQFGGQTVRGFVPPQIFEFRRR